ncbi:hypothetical protein [Cellulomonas aerilata]|uniref:Uncharacterized protein n=1 Tax=Cellulomonas aerilata TaxID=515326 RepID=A0A512DE53_9CELL|nr:hypothetical protein [Cellulomonas aerilata]GEO34510.1 hypothetical protein CAE01nite_22350 [Cellulomonas aerilata]
MSADLLTSPLPGAKDVRDLLEGMLGREVDVRTGGAMVNPGAEGGAQIGAYVDKLGALRALVVADLPLAARAGAAIALVPAGGADVAIEESRLSQALFENAYEVLNVMASLFNVGDAPHVKLDGCWAPGEAVPADVAQWVLSYVRRLDLDVDVKGYGPGKLSVLAL